MPAPAVAALVPTAFGLVGVERGPQGVRQLCLPQSDEGAAWEALDNPASARRSGPAALGDLAFRLQAYFRGEPVDFPDEVDLSGRPPFYRVVYTAARKLAYGQRVSYRDLALMAGRPRAARAVGQAMARNPVCLIIP